MKQWTCKDCVKQGTDACYFKEVLDGYKYCHDIVVDTDYAYEQGGADALNIDMEKPMHFTDEQKAWVKNYIIINAKRQKSDAIDEFVKELLLRLTDAIYSKDVPSMTNLIVEVAEEVRSISR